MANTIEVILKANDQATGVLKSVVGSLDGMGQKLQSIGGQMALVTAPLTAFFATTIQQASDQQTVLAQLDSVIRSTGRAYEETAAAANGLSDSLSKVTRYSDDAILGAENLLLTFTSIGNDILPDTTKAVLDLSTAMGQDLKSSAIQIGKALNDPITGITALRRVGVQFTDAQEEMIKKMVEAGDLMGAQKMILAELNKEFGGSAEAAGKTFAGSLDILKNKFGELQERIGFVLINALQPFITKVGSVIERVTEWVDKNPKLTTVIVALGGALVALGPALVVVGTAMRAISTIMPILSLALGAITSPITLIVAGIAAIGVVLNEFSKAASTAGTAAGGVLTFFEYLGKLISYVVDLVGEKGLFGGIGTFIELLFSNVQDGESIIGTLLQTLGVARDQANAFADSVANGVIGQIGRTIGQFIRELPTNLSLVPFYFTYYFGKVWSAVQPVLQPIIDWFTGTGPDSFGGALAMLPEWIFQNIIAPLQGIWLAVQPLVQPIIDWFNNHFLETIMQVAGWINDNIVVPFGRLIDQLQPAFQQIADFIETIFQPVIDVINQALDSWEMLRRLGGGQPMRALPGETSPGVPGNPNQLVPGVPQTSGQELAAQLLEMQGLSGKLADGLIQMAKTFQQNVASAVWNMVDGVTESSGKATKDIVDSAAKQGVILQTGGKRLADALDTSFKQVSTASDAQSPRLNTGASLLANSIYSAFGYVVASMQAQQAPVLSGAAQLAQSVVGALANLWGQITQFVRDNINASQQGWDYGRDIYPPGFTGTPFPHDFMGRYSAGVPYRVGTGAQPEIFIPDNSGYAIPAGAGGGRSVTIEGDLNFNFPNVTDVTDPRQMDMVVNLLIERLEAEA